MTTKQDDSKPDDSESENEGAAPPQTKSPTEHNTHIDGPMSDDAIHKTESKDMHPQGKTRHGGRRG